MITLKEIKTQIERNVGAKDIGSKSKRDDFPTWRGMYCKIANELTTKSLREIGRLVNLNSPAVSYWIGPPKTAGSFEIVCQSRPDVLQLYKQTLKQLRILSESERNRDEFDREAEEIIGSMGAVRDLEYWKKRCQLAENYISESPCDPDVTSVQLKAYREWQNFKNGKREIT